MDREHMRAALEDVFDQAVVFHGFADHIRDYDVYVYATAAPSSGIAAGYAAATGHRRDAAVVRDGRGPFP